jgi:hypothetical protein
MSAYIVNPEHIAEIAIFFKKELQGHGYNLETKKLLQSDITGIVYDLCTANFQSIKERYADGEKDDWTHFFADGKDYLSWFVEAKLFALPQKRSVSDLDLWNMCNCYEYQSCESENWRKTNAYLMVKKIKDCLATRFHEQLCKGAESVVAWEYEVGR